ncbi:MAG: glycoside hydrolase family 92 protein [Nitrospiraceae bacterium]|nr:glycoside hydrolase family 92 protein [Nitrospiraceae bacterium]
MKTFVKLSVALLLSLTFAFNIWAQKEFYISPDGIEGKETPANLADPLIDTHCPRYDYFISATLPFGMVALSPDTKHGDLWDAGYRYDDKYILNFSHVHNMQTAGIPVMPVTGPCRGNEGIEANKSRFSHEKEEVKLGYYKVFLEDYKITAELTATCRVGMHRYTFPSTDQAHLLFDLGAALGPTEMSYAYARQTGLNEIEGYSVMAPTFRRKKPYVVYFVAQFDKPFKDFAGWKDGVLVKPEAGIVSGKGSGVYVTYNNLREGEQILVKVAISYVSASNARLNLETELPHWDFEKVVSDAQKEWNSYLGRIRVEGGTHEQQVKFYTDLMHTATKRISNDVDGSYADYTGPYPVIRQLPMDKSGAPKYPFMEGDGLFDSHWNLNILWSLVYPEYGNWMAETFLDYYRNAGTMSRCSWGGNYSYVMVGDHSTPLLAALMSTGRATFDPELAYTAARKNAFPGGIRDRSGYEAGPNPSGGGIDWYIDLGYIPVEIAERGKGWHQRGSGMTLEYAYQDWCLAQMARQIGKENDVALFMKRSENWRNVFDPQIGWMRPRLLSGEWAEPFSPVLDEKKPTILGFVEGSSAMFTFYVPQNIEGLIQSMGGKSAFVNKLDSSFIKAQPYKFVTPRGKDETGWVDYGNQPSCGMAHLFSYAGEPWKTQYWVRQVKEVTFGGTDPYSGYLGDEDQGQLGALGVLMAIGLFDEHGCVGEAPTLEITSPIFDKIVIEFPSVEDPSQMKTFEITVKRKNASDIYIQKATLNGERWDSFKFPVTKFFAGGTLEIELGKTPNKKWGVQ